MYHLVVADDEQWEVWKLLNPDTEFWDVIGFGLTRSAAITMALLY